jgi:y4mF family transcriptional regulator
MKVVRSLASAQFVERPVQSPAELGDLIRQERKSQQLTQKDVVGLGNTGNRLIVDIENGKPTVQLQKVFDLLGLLGLEMSIRSRGK